MKIVDLFIAYNNTKIHYFFIYIMGTIHSTHNFAEKQHILVMDMFGHLTIKYKLSSNNKFNLITL